MLILHKPHEEGNTRATTPPLSSTAEPPEDMYSLPIFMSEWEPFRGVMSRHSQTDSAPAFLEHHPFPENEHRLCRRSFIRGVMLTAQLVQCRPARKKYVRRKPRFRFWTLFRKMPWKLSIAAGATLIPRYMSWLSVGDKMRFEAWLKMVFGLCFSREGTAVVVTNPEVDFDRTNTYAHRTIRRDGHARAKQRGGGLCWRVDGVFGIRQTVLHCSFPTEKGEEKAEA